MQNYVKSDVNGTQMNNSYTNVNNSSNIKLDGIKTEVINFDSQGTVKEQTKRMNSSINLNTVGNGTTNSFKSFDELCMLYGNGKTSFTNEDVSDMYIKHFASKGMISNFIKSGYVDGSAIGYLLENGQITVDEARDLAVKTYNNSKASFGDGSNCENYVASIDDGKTISIGYSKYEYAKKEEKDGVKTYYADNGDILVQFYSDKVVLPKANETFYYLGDGNFRLERINHDFTNRYSLNPTYEPIKESTTYYDDGTEKIEYYNESTGYTTTASRSSFDSSNPDAFYTIEKDGKVIACRYGSYSKKYSTVLDSEGLKNYSASNNYERMGKGYINLSEEEFEKNYEIIKDMDYSSSITKTTTWTDGKEYHYESKKILEDGSIVYTLENNMGKKTILKGGEIVTTVPTTIADGKTFELNTFYKENMDGTYTVRDDEFAIKYDKTGYNVYGMDHGHYVFSSHYDYYRG